MNSSPNNGLFNFSLDPNTLIPTITDWLKDNQFFIQSPDLSFIVDFFKEEIFPELSEKITLALLDIVINVAKQDIQTYIDNIKKVNEGQVLIEIKDYQEAIAVFKEVIRKEPRNYKAWFLRSFCLLLLSEFDEAVDSFESTIARKETFEAYYYKAITHVLLQDFDPALESFTQAIRLNPRSSELRFDEARTLEQLGRYSEAVDSYDQSIALEPNNYSAKVNRNLLQGSLEESSDKLIGRGTALIEKARYEEAIACLNKVIEIDSNQADAWSMRGRALNQTRAYQDAIYSYQRAIELNSQLDIAYYGMGISFYRIKKYKSAYIALKQSVKFNQELANAWFYLGLAAYRLGYCKKTIHGYSEFCKINSDSIIGLLYQGHAFRKREDYEQALTAYTSVLEKSPNNLEALVCIGKIYLYWGCEEEALNTFLDIVKLSPKNQYAQKWSEELRERIDAEKERERQRLEAERLECLKEEAIAKNCAYSKPQRRKWFGLF